MKNRVVLIGFGLALSAGCSGQSPNNASNSQTAMQGNDAGAVAAAPPRPSGEVGFRQLAECAATMEALSRLYNVLASNEPGPRGEEMRRTASARSLAALDFEMAASTIGTGLGRTQADIDRIKRERHAAMEQERVLITRRGSRYCHVGFFH